MPIVLGNIMLTVYVIPGSPSPVNRGCCGKSYVPTRRTLISRTIVFFTEIGNDETRVSYIFILIIMHYYCQISSLLSVEINGSRLLYQSFAYLTLFRSPRLQTESFSSPEATATGYQLGSRSQKLIDITHPSVRLKHKPMW